MDTKILVAYIYLSIDNKTNNTVNSYFDFVLDGETLKVFTTDSKSAKFSFVTILNGLKFIKGNNIFALEAMSDKESLSTVVNFNDYVKAYNLYDYFYPFQLNVKNNFQIIYKTDIPNTSTASTINYQIIYLEEI